MVAVDKDDHPDEDLSLGLRLHVRRPSKGLLPVNRRQGRVDLPRRRRTRHRRHSTLANAAAVPFSKPPPLDGRKGGPHNG